MTLTEFLLARTAEDEEWGKNMANHYVFGRYVLAECEAKRRIVERLGAYGREGLEEFRDGWAAGMTDALVLLALPYADHPDYRKEWKP